MRGRKDPRGGSPAPLHPWPSIGSLTHTHLGSVGVPVLLIVLPRDLVGQRLVSLGDVLGKVLVGLGVGVLRMKTSRQGEE